jgi:hypothetical protein
MKVSLTHQHNQIFVFQSAVFDPCEHGNEPSVSITGGEFLDCMSDY